MKPHKGTILGGRSNLVIRSKEFLEGYNACAVGITRTRNPYQALISAETVETLVEAHDKWQEWRDGWNKRFYGEDINSAP